MPNCFNLTPIGETEPKSLAAIDEEICRLFNEEPHPTQYFGHWFDFIGWRITVKGWNLKQVIAYIQTERTAEMLQGEWLDGSYLSTMLIVAEYLDAHYTTNNWVEIGRRD